MDLGALKQLETIELRFPPSVSSSESLDYMKEVIDSAKQVLKASKATGGEKIVLTYTRFEGEEQVHRGMGCVQGYIRIYERDTIVII